MSLRETINNNQPIFIGIAVVGLCIAVYFLITSGTPTHGQRQVWYVNLETKEIFKDSAYVASPITTADGHEAMRVCLYTCGNCNESDRFILYYEKNTDPADPESGVVMCYDDNLEDWYGPRNQSGQMKKIRKMKCPDGSRAKVCRAE